MSKKIPLTQEQYDKLVARQKELEEVAIPNNTLDIQKAREHGDLSENAEYDDAKEAQAKLYNELAQVTNRLENATIIQKELNNDFVTIGHTIKLQNTKTHEQKTLKLLGQWNQEGSTTSIDSPLGQAIYEKKKGEIVVVDAPSGEFTYKIMEIE